MEGNPNRTVDLAELDRFPPTVVGHTEYADGYDLELLDSGTTEEPRFIRIVDGRPAEYVGVER